MCGKQFLAAGTCARWSVSHVGPCLTDYATLCASTFCQGDSFTSLDANISAAPRRDQSELFGVSLSKSCPSRPSSVKRWLLRLTRATQS